MGHRSKDIGKTPKVNELRLNTLCYVIYFGFFTNFQI